MLFDPEYLATISQNVTNSVISINLDNIEATASVGYILNRLASNIVIKNNSFAFLANIIIIIY
jgi:hypothetical protein